MSKAVAMPGAEALVKWCFLNNIKIAIIPTDEEKINFSNVMTESKFYYD